MVVETSSNTCASFLPVQHQSDTLSMKSLILNGIGPNHYNYNERMSVCDLSVN